mmetsp:Transcript_33740/g.82261  ORF Transcript_33740/g.82261 Transcript_33740/m.82261 type:complete len:252 (-) Transcript_33740:3752-4507(-)
MTHSLKEALSCCLVAFLPSFLDAALHTLAKRAMRAASSMIRGKVASTKSPTVRRVKGLLPPATTASRRMRPNCSSASRQTAEQTRLGGSDELGGLATREIWTWTRDSGFLKRREKRPLPCLTSLLLIMVLVQGVPPKRGTDSLFFPALKVSSRGMQACPHDSSLISPLFRAACPVPLVPFLRHSALNSRYSSVPTPVTARREKGLIASFLLNTHSTLPAAFLERGTTCPPPTNLFEAGATMHTRHRLSITS